MSEVKPLKIWRLILWHGGILKRNALWAMKAALVADEWWLATPVGGAGGRW